MDKILLTATTAAHEAGKIIYSLYNSEYEVKMKGKGNPVTDADIAADVDIIINNTPSFSSSFKFHVIVDDIVDEITVINPKNLYNEL